MEAFNTKIVAGHAEEVVAGGHDDQCEWRVTGHFICNCRARKRIAAGFTTPPGPLHYSNPSCSKCYTEVEHDGDDYVCYTCRVYWSPTEQDHEGSFLDQNEPLDVAAWDARDAARAAAAAETNTSTEES